MPVTLKNIIEQPFMGRMQLVAGQKGLEQVVTRTLIGHIDYVTDVHGGELLFITGAGFRADESTLKPLVSESAYKNLAGIVFSIPGNFNAAIDQNVIAFADNLGFPLFQIPWDTKLSKLTKSIEGYIKEKNDEEELLDILMDRIISADPEESDGIKRRIARLGYNFADAYKAAAITISQPQSVFAKSSMNTDYINLYIRNLLGKIGKGVITVSKGSGIEVYVPEDSGLTALPDISGVCDAVMAHFPGINLSAGGWKETGRFGRSPAGDGEVSESGGAEITEYGTFSLFYEALDIKKLKAFCEKHIGKLIKYDSKNDSELIRTIEVYYENRFNLSRTADELKIHRNSLAYRLRRIEEITGQKLDDPYVLLDLINSVYIKTALESTLKSAG